MAEAQALDAAFDALHVEPGKGHWGSRPRSKGQGYEPGGKGKGKDEKAADCKMPRAMVHPGPNIRCS